MSNRDEKIAAPVLLSSSAVHQVPEQPDEEHLERDRTSALHSTVCSEIDGSLRSVAPEHCRAVLLEPPFTEVEISQELQSIASSHCRAVLQQAPSARLRALLGSLHLEALQMLSEAGGTDEQVGMQEWAAAVLLGPNWKSFSTQALKSESARESERIMRPRSLSDSSTSASVDFYGFSVPTDRSSKNFLQMKHLQLHRVKWQHWLAGNNIRQVPCSYMSPTCQIVLNPAPVMSSDMRDLVRKGVPVDLRGCIWFQVSGAYVKFSKAAALRKEGELSYYQQKLHDLNACVEETQSQRDILKDIGRTWTNNIVHMDAAFRLRLRNVLMCYSIRNPQIGYCQSMNFIAGLFLLFLDEESTFWLLATLVFSRANDAIDDSCVCRSPLFRWKSSCLSFSAAACLLSYATKKFSLSALFSSFETVM